MGNLGLRVLKGLMLRILGIIALAVFALIFLLTARMHYTTVRVNNDPSTEPDFAAAKANADSLLQALEKYRGENGLYPVTLDQLNGAYLSSLAAPSPTASSPKASHGFRYSARSNDWVYKSDACESREKSLRDLIMKDAREYKKEVADFKTECLSGYRYFQLQSAAFPHDPQTYAIDRWAYYDSSNRQWSVGWCSHGSRGSSVATNGVCPWGNHGAADPW
jgi:hypothetical protein